VTAPGPRRGRWLLRQPAPDAESRLFCFPYVGTGASMFHAWPRRIGAVEVCPIQLPGRENRMREPGCQTYDELIDGLVPFLAPSLDRPYGLFGHCSSAFLGFETARRLVDMGLPPPARLIVSSMVPPHQPRFGSILQVAEEDLGRETEAMMRARGLEPTPDILEVAVAAMRDDVRAYRRYQGVPAAGPLPFPVTVLAWGGDTYVDAGWTAGWAAYGEVRRVVLDGDHWSFLAPPPDMLTEIERDLAA